MKRNFFELVNNNFFSIFNSKYREINYDILILIDQEMSSGNGQLEKGAIIDLIANYFKENPDIFLGDEGEILEFKKDPSRLVKDFVDAGWLLTQKASDFNIYYQFDPVGLKLIRSMEQAVEEDSKPLESTGFVHTIYQLTETFDPKTSYGLTQRLVGNTDDLEQNLRTVNSKIQKYLNNLINDTSKSPSNILKELLLNYQDNVVAKSFNNLRTRDNPSKYKQAIIDKLNDLIVNHKQELVESYIDEKFNGEKTQNNIDEAERYFTDSFNHVISYFMRINSNINLLDFNNNQYVKSAKSRLMFLLNDKDNLEGKIDRILRKIEDLNLNDNDDIEFDDLNLYELGHVDDTSLYVYQRTTRDEKTIVDDTPSTVSIEKALKYKEQLIRLNKFTIKSVDNFIMSKLGDADSITLNDIHIENLDEFMMIFLAKIYSNSKMAHYKVQNLPTLFTYKENIIQNYKIERRR